LTFISIIPLIELFYIPFREPWAKFDQGYILYMSTYLSFSILKLHNSFAESKMIFKYTLVLLLTFSLIYIITPIFNKKYFFSNSVEFLSNEEVLIFEELSNYAVINEIDCFLLDNDLTNADKVGKLLDLFLNKNTKIISHHLYPVNNAMDLNKVINEFCSDKIIYVSSKRIKDNSSFSYKYNIIDLYFYSIGRELIYRKSQLGEK